MKKILFPLALASVLILTAFSVIDPSEWQLTDEYSIRISGKKINGFFHSMKGKVIFDENKLASSSCNLEIEVASIRTGNSLKSWHAKRAKWFDAKKYPTISFTSEKFQKTTKGFVVNGKLKMKGIERQITIPFEFVHNIFFGQFSVRRTDFKVGTMKGLSKMVSDTIKIEFTIPVKK